MLPITLLVVVPAVLVVVVTVEVEDALVDNVIALKDSV